MTCTSPSTVCRSALVPTLDTAPRRAVTTDQPAEAWLDTSAEIELVLQHLAGQLASVLGQPHLKL